MSWSGGKDSALALYEILHAQDYRVAALVTTLTRDYDEISMHGVRRALLEQQAASLGIPLHQIQISKGASNTEYETKVGEAFSAYREQGVETVVFGDLFLEDIRAYREQLLDKLGMRCLFPVWRRDTRILIRSFLDLGFEAVVTSVDSNALDSSFAGRIIDEDFLKALPAHVDPCGENGEFHTFVFAGPIFKQRIRFRTGEVVLRDTHYFCDLLEAV